MMIFKHKYSRTIQILSFIICIGNLTIAQGQNDSLLTTVFSEVVTLPIDKSGYTFTQEYSPTNSTWAVSDFFSEDIVFQAELNYKHTNPNQSYQLRIGKGGQIYSFRGAFGESVPPQWRNPNKKNASKKAAAQAPWVDEVWQMVAVDTRKNDRKNKQKYFIHQAGVYLKNADQSAPFYSPILAEFHNEKEQSYSIVNWGQQAHTEDNLTAGFTSSILYYTKYTNIGNGIVQVDCMFYNFGNDVINHINTPWGGVRVSSLEYLFISNPDNTYQKEMKRFGQKRENIHHVSETGGWVAYSADDFGNSSALGLVFNRGSLNGQNKMVYGYAGGIKRPNPRDYNVFTIVRRRMKQPISFGKSMSFRYFYVLENSVEAIKNSVIKHELTSKTIEANYTPTKEEVADVYYEVSNNGKNIQVTEAATGWKLKARPYQNSYPIFLISSNNGATIITSNQYHFSKIPYDGKLKSMQLLGFLDKPNEAIVETISIGKGGAIANGNDFINNIQTSLVEVETKDKIIINTIAVDKTYQSNINIEILNNNTVFMICSPNEKGADIDFKTRYKKITAKLYDENRKKIKSKKYRKTNQFNIELPTKSGIYFLNLKLSGGKTSQLKVIVK